MLRLEQTISVGHLLTSASILISALGLGYQLSKDNEAKQLQQANDVRAAAARTLESLDRWREISVSLFDELQPIFVQSSMELATTQLDFGQFCHCGRAHFASAARHGAEFLYGPARGRDRQEIRRPLFFGAFRTGATPKLAKVEIRDQYEFR